LVRILKGEFIVRKPVKKTAAIISLLIAAILLLGGCSTAPATASSSSKVSGTSSSEVSSTPAEVLPTVESLEIDSSVLSDPDKLATAWMNALTNWDNAGATPENAQAAINSGDVNSYATQIATKFDDLFISAEIVDNWQSKPSLVGFINQVKLMHLATLESYCKTSFHYSPDDKTPFTYGTKYSQVNSFVKNNDGSFTLVITESDYNNSDQNRAVKLNSGIPFTTTEYTPTDTFVNVDGKVKLSDMIMGNH
jgi:hypothetical protein